MRANYFEKTLIMCLTSGAVTRVLQNVHAGVCDEYQRGSGLYKQLISMIIGPPGNQIELPSLENVIHVSVMATESIESVLKLHSFYIPWPFHT